MDSTTYTREDWSHVLAPPVSEDRGPKTHISELVAIRMQTPTYDADFGPVMAVGSLFERILIQQLTEHYPARFFRPGELDLDNLLGTPDLADCGSEDGRIIVHEIKCTWKTNRDFEQTDKFEAYVMQLKSYCWMMRARVGYLHVLFIRGNGADKLAELVTWKFTFGIQDLANNWAANRYTARLISERSQPNSGRPQ